VIVETGIAHGGSLVFYASILQLMGHGEVLGVDIDIRQHNREAIESHPMAHRISMIQGSSIDPTIVDEVRARVAGKKVLVVLDSNHTHEHVLEELRRQLLRGNGYGGRRHAPGCLPGSPVGQGRQPENRGLGLSGRKP
jgi:cephalosporin hydroxylase